MDCATSAVGWSISGSTRATRSAMPVTLGSGGVLPKPGQPIWTCCAGWARRSAAGRQNSVLPEAPGRKRSLEGDASNGSSLRVSDIGYPTCLIGRPDG